MSETDFINAKNSVLKYYTDSETSLATRFFAFVTAIFALVIAFGSNVLHRSFEITVLNSQVAVALKLIFFAVGSFVLLVYAVRTVFRYAVFAGLCNRVLLVRSNEIDKAKALHEEIHFKAIQKLEQDGKLYWRIDPKYFISRTDEGIDNKKGWYISIVVALGLIVPLLFLIL